MADRPRDPASPSGDAERPEFGWLYGQGGGQSGQSGQSGRAAPDHTRAMPVQPRPGSAPPPADATRPLRGPAPSEPDRTSFGTGDTDGFGPASEYRARRQGGTAAPGGPPGTAPGRTGRTGGGGFGRRLRRPRFYIRLVMLVVLLWVIYTVAVPLLTLRGLDEVAWEPNGDRPAEQPGTTYLLVGSDSRKGLTAAQRKEFHTGDNPDNLSDTIMLLHTGSGPNVLLSIPRDSYVDVPGYGVGKINGAYSRGGPKLLTRTVEQATGIRIDHYVEIGLGGVASVVDAVGGITVCPEYRMDDPLAGLHIKKGCQHVDGQVALAYSRSRHAQTNGDLDRVKHQREVVAAIGHKVLSPWSVLNPFRWWKLNHSVPDFFRFGDGMGAVDDAKWAMAMAHTTGSSGKTCTMPVTDGSANHWDTTRTKPLFAAIIDDDTSAITADECTQAGIVGAK